MKLLFLHLSDMHLKEDTILKKIDASCIVDSIEKELLKGVQIRKI